MSELCGLPNQLFAVFATVAAAHTCRRVITLAGAVCGERWPNAIDETRSLVAPQAALDLCGRRPSGLALPLGVSPAARCLSRTPPVIPTVVIICVASPPTHCSHDQRNRNTTAVAGGKPISKAVATAVAKAGRVSAYSRYSRAQRVSAALGVHLCCLSSAGCRRSCLWCLLPSQRLIPVDVSLPWPVLRAASVGQRLSTKRVHSWRHRLP